MAGSLAAALHAVSHSLGIDLGREPVPDETTICQFLHLPEAHNQGQQLLLLIEHCRQESAQNPNVPGLNHAMRIAKHHELCDDGPWVG